jgi:hypothetical protein
MPVFELSAKSGEGLDRWFQFLIHQRSATMG